MRRSIVLTLVIAAALLLVVTLTKGIGQAQNLDSQSVTTAGSEPLTEVRQTGPAIEWPSSAPAPEGSQLISPADSSATMDALDTAAATESYDSYLRIAGSAVKPRESSVDWAGTGGGGCIYASAGDAWAVFNTPVYLPQGATAKYLRLYYNDTNDVTNSTAWFTIYDLYGNIVNEYGASSSGNSGNGYATTTEFTHTVDYNTYAYVINWRPYDLGTDTQVCGFRIYYAAPPGPVYMPLMLKDAP